MRARVSPAAVLPRREALAAMLATLAGNDSAPGAPAPTARRIRLIMSAAMIEGVNENDAKAAMKAWAAALVGGTDIELEKDHPRVLPPALVCEALRRGQADAAAITIREFAQTPEVIVPDALIASETARNGGWRYLILTHAGSGITSLAGLQGKILTIWRSPKAYLAREWVEMELHAAGLGTAQAFFSQMPDSDKVSRGVVLPVFFRQADACLVGSSAFQQMCELNPQLKAKLRILATSPNLVTSFFAFHRGLAEEPRKSFQRQVLSLTQSPAGQQALALYQAERLVTCTVSLLGEALELVRRYDQLVRSRGRSR